MDMPSAMPIYLLRDMCFEIRVGDAHAHVHEHRPHAFRNTRPCAHSYTCPCTCAYARPYTKPAYQFPFTSEAPQTRKRGFVDVGRRFFFWCTATFVVRASDCFSYFHFFFVVIFSTQKCDAIPSGGECGFFLRLGIERSVSHLLHSISRIMRHQRFGIVKSHSLSPKSCFLSVRGTGACSLRRNTY